MTSEPNLAPRSPGGDPRARVEWPDRREIEPWERPLLEALGLSLRTAREAAGLSLEDLGPVAGSPTGLREIERGEVRTRASRIRPYCARAGIDAEPLIAEYAEVIAPERPDGRNAWRPVTVRPAPRPEPPRPPELEDHDRAALGAALWGIRIRRVLSRPALAAAVGVTRWMVWKVERGVAMPSVELLERWLRLGSSADVQAIAKRFPAVIAQLAPRPGAHRPIRTRTDAPQPSAQETER